MKVEVIEVSGNGRQVHEEMLRDAVLFHIPRTAFIEEAFAHDIVTQSRAWRERGVMPYPVTATRFSWRSPGDTGYDETAVFTLDHEGRLLFSVHTTFWPEPGKRAEFYTIARDGAHDDVDGISILRPSEDTRRVLRKKEASHAVYMTEIMGGMSRLSFLLEALESVGYSGVALPGPSRQVSRRTGEPRVQYEIVIRKRGDRHVTPAREQFAEVMRRAHMVRAHLRTNWRTGQKTIKVRNFERGGRGEVAKPTYRILEDS